MSERERESRPPTPGSATWQHQAPSGTPRREKEREREKQNGLLLSPLSV